MNINAGFSENNSVYTISIMGDFTFSLLHEFNKSYAHPDVSSAKIVVDFLNTEMIDSSALGMLLKMQKELNKLDKEITIINSNAFIKKILIITNFETKFTVE